MLWKLKQLDRWCVCLRETVRHTVVCQLVTVKDNVMSDCLKLFVCCLCRQTKHLTTRRYETNYRYSNTTRAVLVLEVLYIQSLSSILRFDDLMPNPRFFQALHIILVLRGRTLPSRRVWVSTMQEPQHLAFLRFRWSFYARIATGWYHVMLSP